MSAPTVFVGDPARVDIPIAIYPGVLRTPRLLSDDAFSVQITWLRIIILKIPMVENFQIQCKRTIFAPELMPCVASVRRLITEN